MKSSVSLLRRVRVAVLVLAAAVFVSCAAYTYLYLLPASAKSATIQTRAKPARITIERVGIDLPVIESSYDSKSGEWLISDSAAHWADISAQLNSSTGNTFIYAHNREGLFASTYQMKSGDQAVVTGQDGSRYTYRYTNDWLVTPSNTEILYYQGPAKLTLLCCYGERDELRRLMDFELVGIQR